MVKCLDQFVHGRVKRGEKNGGAVKIEGEVETASRFQQGQEARQGGRQVHQVQEGVGEEDVPGGGAARFPGGEVKGIKGLQSEPGERPGLDSSQPYFPISLSSKPLSRAKAGIRVWAAVILAGRRSTAGIVGVS